MASQEIPLKSDYDLGIGLEGTHVLVTGGAGLIGRHVVGSFLAAGCKVTCADLVSSFPTEQWQHDSDFLFLPNVDITKDIDGAFSAAEARFGMVQTCIALASLDLSVLTPSDSLADMEPAEWQKVLHVNVNGTFYTCQRWLRGLRSHWSELSPDKKKNVGLVIVGSEAGRFGVRTHPAYAAGKSAVQNGLMWSLAQDAPRVCPTARVNAVAPGAVDTERFRSECRQFGEEWKWRESQATTPLARAIPPEDVARTIVLLASEKWSGSVHGQVVPIDAGKTGTVTWTQEELKGKGNDEKLVYMTLV